MEIHPDEFKTINSQIGTGFYSEKRSKFLAFAHHVETESDVKDIVLSYKKKYYDARHVCYAYMLGPEKQTFRSNDDGEPSSTAGKPILGQIVKNGLTDILVVVVRYYGGVNLGTGGLIIAYREAASEAIGNSCVITKRVEGVVDYDFPYIMMNDVMKIVKDMAPRVVEQNYGNTCQIKLSIRRSKVEELKKRLEKLPFSH